MNKKPSKPSKKDLEISSLKAKIEQQADKIEKQAQAILRLKIYLEHARQHKEEERPLMLEDVIIMNDDRFRISSTSTYATLEDAYEKLNNN